MQNTVTASARSMLQIKAKRNKWREARREGAVYAGFGLELEDAERSEAVARLALGWRR